LSAQEIADVAPGSRMQATRRALLAAQTRFPIAQVVVVAAVFAFGAITLPGLASWPSIKDILVLASLVGLASAGQTLLILLGGFDLSVSGFIVASALVVTTLRSQYHWPFGIALLVSVAVAGTMGAFAGQICHRLRIQPLIVTLAMGTIALGLIQVQTGGQLGAGAPPWLTTLASPASHTFGVNVPPLVVIWVVVAALMAVFLHRTTPGRHLLGTGANPRAAEYSLINTRRLWTSAFAFSAIASALVGVLVAGFTGSVDDSIGDPYLFQSVVAVIVGGTIFGGPGDYTRTVVGALFVTVLTVVLVGHGASAATEQIVYGLAILLAVTTYGRRRRLRDQI
jgi:ribose transport system permease protein